MSFLAGGATSVGPASGAIGSVATAASPGTAASYGGGGASVPAGGGPASVVGGGGGFNGGSLMDLIGALGSNAEEISNNLKGIGGAAKGASEIVRALSTTTVQDNLSKIQTNRLLEQEFLSLTGRTTPPPVPTDPGAARNLLRAFGLPGG